MNTLLQRRENDTSLLSTVQFFPSDLSYFLASHESIYQISNIIYFLQSSRFDDLVMYYRNNTNINIVNIHSFHSQFTSFLYRHFCSHNCLERKLRLDACDDSMLILIHHAFLNLKKMIIFKHYLKGSTYH